MCGHFNFRWVFQQLISHLKLDQSTNLELEYLRVPHVRQCTQLVQNGLGHDLIDTDNGNGVLRCGCQPRWRVVMLLLGLAQDGAEGRAADCPISRALTGEGEN